MARVRQYDVEVLESKSHGRDGKSYYYGMGLAAYSKKGAENFAFDIVCGMTFEEAADSCLEEWRGFFLGLSKKHPGMIGPELTEHYFSFKAYCSSRVD